MRHSTLVIALAVAIPAASGAQEIRKSQLASVSQMIGIARVEIIYRRPVARGRELFGGVVRWGHLWSPSADSAAIFSTTRDLTISGSRLPAGRYSVWMIPDKQLWTVIFSSATPAFHLDHTEGRDVLSLKVRPREGDHMESLAFYFPMVDSDSAVLALHWGKTVIPMPIKAAQ
jgi:hypothetical protein